MLHGRTYKKLLTAFLCAALILPAPGQANDSHQPSVAMDGDGVFLEKLEVGGQVYYLAAGVASQEKEAVEAVAKQGENGTLIVSGPNDPALKMASGSSVNVIVAEGAENLHLPKAFFGSPSMRKRIANKIDSITAFFRNKEKQKGLTFALINASALTSLAVYSSGSVEKGIAVMAVSFAWAAFLMTAPETWGSLLDRGGSGARWLADKVFGSFGRKLTRVESRQYDLIGKFVTSWIPNTIVAGTVFYGSGTLLMESWWSAFIQSAVTGLILNYNIWDTVVDQKVRDGALSDVFRRRYFLGQVLLGTLLEVSSYAGFAQAQNILAATTMAGVAYLSGQERIEETIIPRARMLSSRVARTRETCELALVSMKDSFVRRPAARPKPTPIRHVPDDVQ